MRGVCFARTFYALLRKLISKPSRRGFDGVPMNEGNVYTMEGNSDRHIYRANSFWWIADTSSMSSGADSGYFHSQGA